ncbi:hypothetical protein Cs7R123_41250 [Catellatospora sp. TT07R-123]|uniref:hypothetical protein n=1 Tax=Catellatospora sp. TT07R-123 TaxID=2733863 RepID=UPI001B1C64E6|nr:hypothetical protein [Catellatospora sp. TT07R-123]GHJ46783.1 hypothetical protein Cs7R123_41250 [Catellatospora sp. TT07R-123]
MWVEIACDESGYEGEKLIGTTTAVFAHAGLDLDAAAAEDCMRELRERIRSPATEYKANHLLRDKHRRVLVWLLGEQAPLVGHAHVFLLDKAFYVLGKVADLLLAAPQAALGVGLSADGAARQAARVLYGARPALPAGAWSTLLHTGNDLLRVRDRQLTAEPVDRFARALDDLVAVAQDGEAAQVLAAMRAAVGRAVAFRRRLADEPESTGLLDPLLPALVAAVGWWSRDGAPVLVAHDRQTTLSPERVAQLRRDLPALAGLGLVASSGDARVQLADVLAGVIRKIATDELDGAGDAELSALVRPYLHPDAVWSDPRSWAVLTGP